MGMHRAGWRSYIRYDEENDRPQISWALVKRVATYARPYWPRIVLLVVLITLTSGISLASPLLFRDLIDRALPERDATRLNWLALGLFGLPLLAGLIRVAQRYLSSSVGEGIICDLRQAVYGHLQRMSMRFFTHTKTGEMMSRLNNDVNGAQRAVTGTLVNLDDDYMPIEMSDPIALGFDFYFFGTNYTEVFVSNNGFLTVLPGQSPGCCSGAPIPYAGSPNGVIAGW